MPEYQTNLVFKLGDRLKKPVYGRLHEDSAPVLLLAAGKIIETEHQLQLLQDAGFTVILPDGRRKVLKSSGVKDGRPGANADFDERVEYCNKLRKTVFDATKDLNARVASGTQPEFAAMISVSEMVASEVTTDPQAFSALTYLRGCDDYTVEHSADVAILMVAIAHILKLRPEEMEIVALSGMLHDVGKQMIPQGILLKSGRLTEDEFKIMRRHPEYGMRILAEWEDCPEAVMEVALQHHERLDGSGYPLGTPGSGLHPYSKVAAVADTFDAITANRCYQSASSARHALTQLYSSRESKYDGPSVDALIRLVGAYPVGTRVRLSTGEIGVVIMPNMEDPTHPTVEVDTHPSGKPIPVKYRVKLNGMTCWIVEVVDAET